MTCAPLNPAASDAPTGISRRLLLAGGAATAGVALLPGSRAALAATGTNLYNTPDLTAKTVVPIMFPIIPKAGTKVTRTRNFGQDRTSHTHAGEDMMAEKLSLLVACADAKVVRYVEESGGNYLYLQGKSSTGKYDGYIFGYLHINNDTPGTDDAKNPHEWAYAPGVALGAEVKKGQHIAYVGDSGNAEGSGAHLHFEIRKPNATWYYAQAINPAPSLDAAEPAKVLGETAPVEAATGTYAPFATAQAFATRQGTDFLAATPTAAWLADAVARLGSGTRPDAFIASLLGEPAQADKVAPAVRLYQAYFLRVPDTGGITYWVEQVRKGVSLDKVSDSFARSSEFINRYGKLANADFVRRVYLNLFEREPDPGGYLFWTAQLDDGKARGWVMRQLCESTEYVRKTDSGVAVVSLHLAMLGRAPNATDSQNWTSMARANTGALAMLAAQIRATDEYASRALG